MRQILINHIKNLPGWRTNRKIVVISVDDYGNIRLDSKEARERIEKAGLSIHSRFDSFDTLETREDLEALFEVLTSVKDKNGKSAIFTPFALPCNIDFESMKKEDYQRYKNELLPITFEKLAGIYPQAYEKTWDLWQEGLNRGIMVPQFHGREHFNVKVFAEKLQKRDDEVLVALKNRSYSSISNSGYSTFGWTAAFGFWDPKENEDLIKIAEEGIDAFKKVFGYAPVHFMAPTAQVHPSVLDATSEKGITTVDTALVQKEHHGLGSFKKSLNYTGKKRGKNQRFLVRNVVFEPTESYNIDSVALALKQIEASFRMRKPAIISSHRVNFCGHISPKNRREGLHALQQLLRSIVNKWPDVEFMSSQELISLMH